MRTPFREVHSERFGFEGGERLQRWCSDDDDAMIRGG